MDGDAMGRLTGARLFRKTGSDQERRGEERRVLTELGIWRHAKGG